MARARDRPRSRPAPRRSSGRPRREGPRSSSGSSVPENAELPNRLRPKRAPSSSAQSTSVSVRGGASPSAAQARSTPSAAITPKRAVEPAAVGDRVQMRAERQRRLPLPLDRGPQVPRRVRALPSRRSRRAARRGTSRAAPPLAPAQPLRPLGPAGAPVELAEVGDHPARRRSPARSLITRQALAAKRLGEAVGAASAQGEHRQIELVDRQPVGSHRRVQRARAAATESTRSPPSEIALAPSWKASSSGDLDQLEARALEASPRTPPESDLGADRGQPLGEHRDAARRCGRSARGSAPPGPPSRPRRARRRAGGPPPPGCGPRRRRSPRSPARGSSRRRPRARPAVIMPRIGISFSW